MSSVPAGGRVLDVPARRWRARSTVGVPPSYLWRSRRCCAAAGAALEADTFDVSRMMLLSLYQRWHRRCGSRGRWLRESSMVCVHVTCALGCTRLSFASSATFLSFFCMTIPQLSQNFRESFSHRPRCCSKGQVLSTPFWRGLHFSALF